MRNAQKHKLTPILSVLLVAIIAQSSSGGEISPELAARISSAPADSIVRVWIKLPDQEEPATFRRSVEASSNTRVGRYHEASSRLRDRHGRAQRNLIAELNRLERASRCRNINPSWLINVVEVDMSLGELHALAARPDVEAIQAPPKLTLIEPLVSQSGTPDQTALTAGIEPNLTAINAPQAWDAGYRGKGRVICSFDNGVDGDHPALFDSWKGHDGDSAAAWFDPSYKESFPHWIPPPPWSTTSASHGSHTMGILVGHSAAGDTIGVALDAKWISAAVIDVEGASYIDAFEWAANPDGDPNSVSDVPDVISHSWGLDILGCQDMFYSLIENLEALGIVNIFAAGNVLIGVAGPMSIFNPANRAVDSIDCFAVGNVDSRDNPPVIAISSSRGPSDCNGATKPNVCAPGQSIRSANRSGGYTFMSGTSMAAPHVAGLVALLRGKNPNASVTEIKNAILTTARDFEYNLPNNDYGWGIIDCMAALNALSSGSATPDIRVFSFDHAPIAPGSDVKGRIALQNLGGGVPNVSATIIGSHSLLTVRSGSAFFGFIDVGDTVFSNDTIHVSVSDTVVEGTLLSLDMEIVGLGYSDTTKLYFLVEPRTERMMRTHDAGNIQFTVSNFGTLGMGPLSFFPVSGGMGFDHNGGGNDMWEGSFIMGINPSHVSDGVRNPFGEPDGDFRVIPGGNFRVDSIGAGTTQKFTSKYSDMRAETPIGLDVTQLTYAFSEPTLDDVIIMRYLIINRNEFSVNNLYAGLFLDWDLYPYTSNAGGWDHSLGAAWMAYNNPITAEMERFRATLPLEGTPASALTELGSEVYYPEGYTELEKYNALTAGFSSADTYTAIRRDLFQVVSVGPLNIAAGDTAIAAFALIAADDWAQVTQSAGYASLVYDTLISTCCTGSTGNTNNDPEDLATILDITFLVDAIFRGGPDPVCLDEANVDGSDQKAYSILDLTYLVDLVFRGGPDPVQCAGY